MPNDAEPIDIAALRSWIGRQECASDVVTSRLEASLRAVFDRPVGSPVAGEPATPTVHWCLAPAIAPMSGLGAEGHPARGGFMPPVPLPRRMWAGGDLTLLDPLRVGDTVTRTSTIADVVVKEGRTGTLCFVTVRHSLTTARGTAVEERQDVVYRDPVSGAPPVGRQSLPQPEPRWRRVVACDPVLLFRYSALTFNGHRIHYDRPYATEVEGYADLVVHGPLQAALLLDHAAQVRGSLPRSFSFRGVNPLFANGPFSLNAVEHEGGLRLWSADAGGRLAMEATARWP